MESQRASQETKTPWFGPKSIGRRIRYKVGEFFNTAKTIGTDDPRRIIHAVKVGLAITLVSLFYYFDPLFEGFGVAAIWAVLTVVVVFEFSVGATLGKGLNRMVATFLAAVLGVGAHRIATLCGEKAEPILLGLFVFLIAAVMTFLRFFPKLKARYDYGLMIFILTFALVCVSAYREDEVIAMAQERISTILIGSLVAMATCVFLYPVWAGTDLHHLEADNVEKLGNFLQEFGQLYFREPVGAEISLEKKAWIEGFKTIANSKNNEESLVNLAKWEPHHGRFRYRHPWHQYLKIGNLARECACTLYSLNRHLHADRQTNIQVPVEVKSQIKDICTKISMESGNALKELSKAMKKMAYRKATIRTHIESSRSNSKKLTTLFKRRRSLWVDGGRDDCQEEDDFDLSPVVSAVTVASLLLDAASLTEKIAEAIEELASLSRFEKPAAEDGDGGEDLEVGEESDQEEVVGSSERIRHRKEEEDPLPPSLAMIQQSGE